MVQQVIIRWGIVKLWNGRDGGNSSGLVRRRSSRARRALCLVIQRSGPAFSALFHHRRTLLIIRLGRDSSLLRLFFRACLRLGFLFRLELRAVIKVDVAKNVIQNKIAIRLLR
jgi:hypothetical protein